jgi:formylglycine-generating enzyme required for sulfatase activity
VGNAGNANDPLTGLGGVSYAYNIGKYDVTLTQYAQFLNAVASVGGTTASDPYGLYNSQMGSDVTVEGISRSVVGGNYVYTVVGDGSRPVTYVSWFDAARLANWMQNGQPTGVVEGPTAATETGAYTLSGATSGVILKNTGAQYWIPNENEWYKAAYYDPTLNGGLGGYWQFATRSNTFPGNNASSPTTANQANYDNGVYSVTQSSATPVDNPTNYLTDVGEFTNSGSYYGTFDQNGLVYQWTDLVADGNTERGERGGSWQGGAFAFYTPTASDLGTAPGEENAGLGIRLASAVAVPEPTVACLFLAGGLLLVRRKRSRAA